MFSRRSISTLMVVGVVAAFAPQQTTNQCNIQSQSLPLPMQLLNDEEEHNTRRNFLTKVVATAVTPILLTSTQASAAVGE